MIADAPFFEQADKRDVVDVLVDVEIAEARLDAAMKRIARGIEQRGIGLGHAAAIVLRGSVSASC